MGDEGDEDDETPISYTFSAESKLDEDHLFYLQFTNNFISNVTRPRDFDHCTRWLEKLAGEPMYGVEAKRNRNMYLAMLLIAMQDNKVKGPFATFPPNGPLPHAGDAFGLTPEEERAGQINLAFDIQDRELIMSEYKYQSADGRTFVATCALPEGLGCMGYVGISYGGGEGLWLNQEGCQVGLNEVLDKDVIPVINPQTPVAKHIEMVEAYDWSKPIILPEDAVPFAYLHKVPQVRSNSNLVQIQGAHRLTPFGRVLLCNKYPEELVSFLAKLVEKSKKEIDTLLRERHDKVIAQIYEEYQFEVERWLNEYKLARQEWQQVMNVIREIQEAEVEARKYSVEITEAAGDSMRVLSDALNDARKRKRIGIRDVMRLDNLKSDMHRDIHSRLLLHKRDLAATEGRVNELEGEIKRLRNESRHKRQIVEGLVSELSADT